MQRNLNDYHEFNKAIQNDELVFLFGTGISSALTGQSYSWQKWITDGINSCTDKTKAKQLRDQLDNDYSTTNMINVCGKVIALTKDEGTYHSWMHNAFETNKVNNYELSDTLKKLILSQVVFATTNYDSLLESATGLPGLSYENTDEAFYMLDKRMSTHILHIHGIYDSINGIDNIVADEEQYTSVMENQGAQFIQNILGTRTLVFVGCGKTTEDANISRFIEFAIKHLKLERTYYYLCKEHIEGLPDHIEQIIYGDDYSDLPYFLEDIAQTRLKKVISNNRIIGRTVFGSVDISGDNLLRYHFAQRMIKFCGRKNELARLLDFVKDDRKFLWWAVTGQAGAGKSRLALELLYNLPISWFGFFINDDINQSDYDKLTPFSDTIVIVDYVAGKERFVAEAIQEIYRRFDSSAYKLRILLLERENNRTTGSWYSKLVRRVSKSDVIKANEYSEEFLYLSDMERDDVEAFIISVCESQGASCDNASELYEVYGSKFERLRFRPLYLQMFVEAWIDNDYVFPQYNSYEQLLEHILDREQDRWIVSVGGDMNICNAFIRLMVRANISGRIAIDELPDIYKGDWNTVQAYINQNSFVGRQKRELQDTLINSFCQNIDEEHAIIAPQFPDIIKEYMFRYYTDNEFLPDMMKEVWQHSASAFHIFIMRCMMDFPECSFYKEAINAYKYSKADYDVLVGRLDMLDGRLIQKGEDPRVFWEIIDNEYQFWNSLEISEEDTEGVDILASTKLTGLYRIAQNVGAWSLYDISEMEEVIDQMLEVNGGEATEVLKKAFLHEHINELSVKGFFDEAELNRKKLDKLTAKSNDGDFDNLLNMYNLNNEMMSVLLEGDIEEGKEVFQKITDECDYNSLLCVQALSHSCFNIDNIFIPFSEQEFIGLPVVDKCEALYPDDLIIRARRIGCQAFQFQRQYFEMKLDKEALRTKVNELEVELSAMHFNGSETDEALELTWGTVMILKLNIASKEEVESIIAEAKDILNRFSRLSMVAATCIQAVRALHTEHLKDKVSHNEVETLYRYVENNPESESVRDAFLSLLKESEDADNSDDYLSQDIIREAISTARYNPMFDSGIPEIDELFNPAYSVVEPFKRSKSKIGRNDPCPCGSGKKFKKCCIGKGIYD